MITFVVPAYNTQRHLRQCVESILAQSDADLEVVLVDDGSTDATGAICDEFALADPRVRVIHKKNGGLSASRNSGIMEAKGEWLSFVDADDALHPNFSEKLLNIAQEYGGDVVVSQLFKSRICKWPPVKRINIKTYASEEAVETSLYQHSLNNSACGKLFKANLFSELRFRDGGYEDLDLFHQLCQLANKITETNEALYFYRINPESYTHVFTPQRLDVLRVVDNIETAYADNPRLSKAARDRKFAANFNMFLLCQKPECWQTVKRLRREVLFNPKSRAKNKAGAMLSYLGKRAALIVNKLWK